MSVISLVERLSPLIQSELNLVIKSEEEAASLSEKLEKIQEGLQEVEREGVTNKSVKGWLKQLEDVTYEMDDVLDEWESTKLQVEVQDTSLNWDKVCSSSLLASLYSCFNQVRSRREATLKMKALSVRIDNILTDKGKYTFVSGVNDRAHEFKQGESTSLVNKKNKVYGLEGVKKNLVDKLVKKNKVYGLEGEGSGDDTQIIAIVGVGGVGKSTLAREAFNDPEVDGHFALKGWVSVSQTLDSKDFAKAILERFVNKSDDALRLETAVQRIIKVVDNKRFLLVLDNVWKEDTSKWEEIKNCLDGGKGSRIVVTTRDKNVAIMMGTTQWQPLDLLSDLECGIILNGVALESRTREEREKLRDIGMDIAKKCNGLPLAANSVGSMLALRSSEREWRAVLESPLWKDKDEPSNLFRLLNLSYTDLSPVLKRCLLSSVIFPKGSSFGIDEISRVWMACGYLNSNGVVDEVQLQGFQYLDELTMRSFFQRVADEDGVSYKMHDIMYDFATHLLGSDEYSFIRESGLAKEPPWNSLGRFRTFCVSREELCPDLVGHLTSVRVLSVRDCNLQAIPEKVGNLVHLRYLNVSRNPITKLPEAITGLCNLQTLDVGSCKNLTSLPQGIGKLIKLRHFINSDTSELVEFPQGLEKLTGLQTLNEFRGSNLGCLRNLNQLQGSLSLFLENLGEGEFGDPYLWEKQHIHKLELEFGPAEEKDEIVEALKPPPNLLTLVVASRSGKWLSHWIHTSFVNLKVVWFFGALECSDVWHVPPFCKLPALEELHIASCSFERLSVRFLGLEDANNSISTQVAGGFQRLKMLSFLYCPNWKEWEDIEQESVPIMPLLEELEIEACSRLDSLPNWLLGKATSLQRVNLYSRNLYKRYNKISGYDRDKIPKQGWTVEE